MYTPQIEKAAWLCLANAFQAACDVTPPPDPSPPTVHCDSPQRPHRTLSYFTHTFPILFSLLHVDRLSAILQSDEPNNDFH